ncbi:MAG TPA: hypothetical protein G4O02_01895 [Caldilineae bacterium]|nr:hypothetical protein [Caldilineae bacterium]
MKAEEITRDFFDKELYAIYLAAWEEWGDEAWKIVWRSGEIMLDEIEAELDLDGTTWIEGLQRLADYLAKVGYVRYISVKQVGEDRVEYDMFDPAILPGAKRLVAMGAVPGHVSTTLMFALLAKRYGLRAEMIGDPDLRDDGHAIEQWRVLPLEEK